MLQARVEEVIKEFNQEMEASEEKMERMRTIVINEAKSVIAKLEEAEARRKEELGRRMNELIEKLSGDLEVMSVRCRNVSPSFSSAGDGEAGRGIEAVLFRARPPCQRYAEVLNQHQAAQIVLCLATYMSLDCQLYISVSLSLQYYHTVLAGQWS